MDQPPQLQPPKTFYLRDLFLWPLMFAALFYSLFPRPLISQVDPNFSGWAKVLFCYLISLFGFPLLSSIVFTRVASLKRLFITHLWVSLAMVLYNAASLGLLNLSSLADSTYTPIMDPDPIMFFSIVLVGLFLHHTDDVSLWRLASLPEPDYGAVAAWMEKSKLVICGVNGVFLYLCICNGVIKLVRVKNNAESS
ncbi:hypothetical protein RHMOL_Rhmol03G0018100 [Rhododendron molle]|uniref:Uncharacterized protein n=1 Tax=Rhododendron molle TaxID=49168 RepID=A0ACC0PB06_RHOML|nr:hypothetical protein RHMOL_Rhmol03G0018100 [Rhododendron molle]